MYLIGTGLSGVTDKIRLNIDLWEISKLEVKYLLDNCYFKLGNKIFSQNIWIQLGSDPALFLAILFLYYHKNKWTKKWKIMILDDQGDTKIPRDKLIRILSEYIDFCFTGGDGRLLCLIGMGLTGVTDKNQAQYWFIRPL